MRNKILLVDGSNLLFQMFFGMPARIFGTDGRGIWGTLGFVGALLKIIRWTAPTHVAVLFDGEHENARALLNPDYKANRTDYGTVPDEENPFSQLPDIKRALQSLGIVHAETTDCEADDWMAGYVFRYGEENEMVLSSFDSDLFQLIGKNVRILRYRGKKTYLCGIEYLQEKFGILPDQYADWKSLTGDSSDNIKGAEKVGPKIASALLAQFGTLEGILQNAEKIERPSVRKSVLEHAERLRQNHKLICLRGVSLLPFSLDEMEYRQDDRTAVQVLREIGLME